ncbi:Beta-ketoacyl-acyl-carrier-protein synthase I [Candidatus Methylobacter favarea]|uniref:Beta-ketoacyl-acyl-carrier-protein synthase I n=1 Tax=Candidatus Methylobacter favarea TaxID=2707345 RepID=A0A8S0WRA2_9GAMM|nr:beta-ketoacyl-ACP synthase [Candidatus Methylobacter favarea]CAA9891921.1 Beta-ketoacyl-acyl-carrier-protein synthase I [Candidatus Methylobacter favarea]
MLTRRVVVTGMAGISPIGNDWPQVSARLKSRSTGIQIMPDWEKYKGLNTRLGAPADFSKPEHYSRKETRSMGRVALMATYATELALIDAGLLNDPCLKSGKAGISYGSCAGSFDAIADFGNMLLNHTTNGLNATSYIRMMGHTAPVNIGLFFGINGRVYTTSSACASGSQGIGYAYEAIKYGHQTLMVAGGAEELSASEAAVFDTLFATSIRNETPDKSPRPFDRDRDGLVIGEGAGTLILEELDHALARGAHIHAELTGFGTNSDGLHVTQPDSGSMQRAMCLALQDARLEASDIGYISAHGTATGHGDIAESHATAAVFGSHVPISSMKSYTGHTLGACGALEAWATINMMNEGWFHPTVNLENIDSACAQLDYIKGDVRKLECDYVMSNNFAFGGINTSLIFKRWD